MASKDFKVKKGLAVEQDITLKGGLKSVDASGVVTVLIDSSGTIPAAGAGFDSASISDLIDSSYVRLRVPTDQELRTTSNVTFNQLRGPANFIIDPATIGDNTGTVEILGNLTVQGTTTTLNSTTLIVSDKNIVLADGAATAAAADGAGITIDGANASLTYVAANDKFAFNKRVDITGQANVSGDFTVDTNTFVVGATSNHVGIGTSPLAAATLSILEDVGTADQSQLALGNANGSFLRLGITGTGANENAHIKTNANENLEFQIGQAANDASPNFLFSTSGNFSLTGTVDGRDVAADGTKLDGIASGATANPNAIDNVVEDTTPQLGGNLDLNNKNITGTGGIQITGNIELPDNYEARFGTGLDLTLAHFGGNSEIRNRTGELKILGDDIKIRNDANSEVYISAVNNGAVELYHNNVKKLETTSTGVSVTGTVTATSFAGDGSNLTGLAAGGLDSGLVTQLVDSDYVQNRVKKELTITTAGGGVYKFTGYGYTSQSGNNPNLYFVRGEEYIINNPAGTGGTGAHPLYIKTQSSSGSANQYTTGVSGNGSTKVTFKVPFDAPNVLYYQCSIHSNMLGSIYILDESGSTTQSWASITGTPTTIAGYGITDAFDGAFGSLSGTPTTISGYGITDAQATLVSGTNIKTINNQSLLGSGNITISGGGGGTVDSASTITLIQETVDSAYVQARQITGGGGGSGTDSAAVIQLIDSDYVQARQAAGAGITVRDEGSTLQTLGTVLNFVGDGVTASGTGSIKTITVSGGGGGGGTDSAAVIQLIDSNYVQARIDGGFESKITDVKYVATQGQTIFSGSGLDLGTNNFQVFVNGVRLLASDFSADPTTNVITLNLGADLNDEVVVSTYTSNKLDRVFVTNPGTDQFLFVADSGQTSFSGLDASSSPLSYNTADFQVFLNGILLRSTDYTATSSSTLTLAEAADSADELSIVSYNSNANKFGAGTGKLSNFVYTATAGQTVFSGSDTNNSVLNYTADNVVVYKQGVYLVKGVDYNTTSQNSITLTSGATVGDKVVIQDFSPTFASLPLTQIAPRFTDYKYVASSGQTVFSGNDQNGQALTLVSDNHAVFVNGIRLLSSDFSTNTTANSITLAFAAADSDEVVISTLTGSPSSYDQTTIEGIVDSAYVQARQTAGGGGTVDSAAVLDIVNSAATTDILNNVNHFRFRADSGQTSFTGTDYYGNTLSFAQGNQVVYYNGSLVLETADYTTGNNSITFNSGVDSDDDIIIVEHQAKVRVGQTARLLDTFNFTATANQVAFTGADANGLTLSYNVGNISVFRNGLILNDVTDYTAVDGETITLAANSTVGDEITVQSIRQGQFSSDKTYKGIAGNYNIAAGERIIVDTSSARTITLPTSAVLGDEVRIIDGTGQAATNNITINRNGHKIQGQSTDLTINVTRAALGLVYYNSANGWLLTEK